MPKQGKQPKRKANPDAVSKPKKAVKKSTTGSKKKAAKKPKPVPRPLKRGERPKPASAKYDSKNYRGFEQTTQAKLARETSTVQPYKLRMRRIAKQLARAAKKDHARLRKTRTIAKSGNVIRMAPCIAYSLPDSDEPDHVHTWTKILDKVWNSGLKTESGKSQQESVKTWLNATRTDPTFLAMGEGINKKIPAATELFTDKRTSGLQASTWAHSEVAAAGDPALDGLLDTALREFLRAVGADDIIIRDAVLAVASEPNVMCNGACRHAIKSLGVRYEAKVTALASPQIRMSGNTLTGTYVTASRQFGPQGVAYNKEILPRIDPEHDFKRGGRKNLEKAAHGGKTKQEDLAYSSEEDSRSEGEFHDSRYPDSLDSESTDEETPIETERSADELDDESGEGTDSGEMSADEAEEAFAEASDDDPRPTKIDPRAGEYSDDGEPFDYEDDGRHKADEPADADELSPEEMAAYLATIDDDDERVGEEDDDERVGEDDDDKTPVPNPPASKYFSWLS